MSEEINPMAFIKTLCVFHCAVNISVVGAFYSPRISGPSRLKLHKDFFLFYSTEKKGNKEDHIK